MFLQRCRVSQLWTLPDIRHVPCRKHILCSETLYHSVFCCLIWCCLVRIRIDKCFMNSCRWFLCEVMFKNEQVLLVNSLCSHLHSFCAHGQEQQGDLDLSVPGEVGREYYTGVDLLLISFLYHSIWLLLGCILNGTLYSWLEDDAVVLKHVLPSKVYACVRSN
jgi:hypothetical protein